MLSAPSRAESLEFGLTVSKKLVNAYDGSIETRTKTGKWIKSTATLLKNATRNLYKHDGEFRELIGTILHSKRRNSLKSAPWISILCRCSRSLVPPMGFIQASQSDDVGLRI
ncbi:MAG: hypothetical protein NTV15_00255 [Candidatus Bathyarchaeota archaeon]|nr:hypothetical protein [Candidatus Bathyarchaeota archaeon]